MPSKQSVNRTGCELMNKIKEKFTVAKRNATKRNGSLTAIYDSNRKGDRLTVDALIEALHTRVMADSETMNDSQVFSRTIAKDDAKHGDGEITADEGSAKDVPATRLEQAADGGPTDRTQSGTDGAAGKVRSDAHRDLKPARRVDAGLSIRVENLDRSVQSLDRFLTRFLLMLGALDERNDLNDILELIESYPSSVNVTIVRNGDQCPHQKLDDRTLLQSIVHRLKHIRGTRHQQHQ